MRVKLIITAIIAASVSILGLNAPAHASWGVDNQHQLIPMYIYPFWWVSGNDWYRVCDNMNTSGIGSTAIMNPDNGPGSSRNSDYDYVIDRCHDAGNNVIGYVDTNYGAVSITTVKANIDKYYAWYNVNVGGIDGRIDGIFLDRMSNDYSNTGSYYREIFNYIKSVAPSSLQNDVIGNPGAPATTDWQLHNTGTPTQAADEVVIFEGPLAGGSGWGWEDFSEPGWVSNYPASDIAMLVYALLFFQWRHWNRVHKLEKQQCWISRRHKL